MDSPNYSEQGLFTSSECDFWVPLACGTAWHLGKSQLFCENKRDSVDQQYNFILEENAFKKSLHKDRRDYVLLGPWSDLSIQRKSTNLAGDFWEIKT